MGRGIRMAAGALALVLAGGASATAAATEARILAPDGQVQAVKGGRPTATIVKDPPAEAELRALRLERTDDGGYIATVSFASPAWKRITRFGGRPATQQVQLTLQPPSGGLMRVLSDADDEAVIEKQAGNRWSPAGSAAARVDGDALVLEIPASVGMTGEWEVRARTFVQNDAGSGVHASTPFVLAGSLSGEQGRVIRLPKKGALLDLDGAMDIYDRREEMPAGSRPVSMAMTRNADGFVVSVEMDAPPAAATFLGRKAKVQFVGLSIGEPGDSYTVLYDVLRKRVYGSPSDESLGTLDASFVEVSGSVISFKLDGQKPGKAAGMSGDFVLAGALAVPEQAAEPPPQIGYDTPIGVAAFLFTDVCGVAVETPIVPVGEMVPEPPSRVATVENPSDPLFEGPEWLFLLAFTVAVVLLVPRFIRRRRAPAPIGGPRQVAIVVNPTEDERGRDCSDLEQEVLMARMAVEDAEREVERARAAEQRELERRTDIVDVIGAPYGEFAAEMKPGSPEFKRLEGMMRETRRPLDDAEDEAEDAERDLERAHRRLAEAEEALDECRGGR